MSEKETKKLFGSITNIGDDIIENAQTPKQISKSKRKQNSAKLYQRIASVACICLVVGCVLYLGLKQPKQPTYSVSNTVSMFSADIDGRSVCYYSDGSIRVDVTQYDLSAAHTLAILENGDEVFATMGGAGNGIVLRGRNWYRAPWWNFQTGVEALAFYGVNGPEDLLSYSVTTYSDDSDPGQTNTYTDIERLTALYELLCRTEDDLPEPSGITAENLGITESPPEGTQEYNDAVASDAVDFELELESGLRLLFRFFYSSKLLYLDYEAYDAWFGSVLTGEQYDTMLWLIE